MLSLVARTPVVEASFFFFFQPAAGPTNRVPVRDCRAGTPLWNTIFIQLWQSSSKLLTYQAIYQVWPRYLYSSILQSTYRPSSCRDASSHSLFQQSWKKSVQVVVNSALSEVSELVLPQ